MEDAEASIVNRVSEKLTEIKDYIDTEYLSLKKSKNRARTSNGIITKTNLLKENLTEYEKLLEDHEKYFSTQNWNKYTDALNYIKTKVKLCIQILQNTKVIPQRDKSRERRNSEHLLESFEFEQNFFRIEEDLPLSSTFLEDSQERKESNLRSFLERSKKIEIDSANLNIAIDKQNDQYNTSSSELFQIVRKSLIKKRKMAFQVEHAIQLIPEFRGVAAELDAFMFQIDYFKNLIGTEQSQEPLINVVLLKLKGPAAAYFKRIKAATIDEVKANLIREFGDRKSVV